MDGQVDPRVGEQKRILFISASSFVLTAPVFVQMHGYGKKPGKLLAGQWSIHQGDCC